jgi:hypothetical protein
VNPVEVNPCIHPRINLIIMIANVCHKKILNPILQAMKMFFYTSSEEIM